MCIAAWRSGHWVSLTSFKELPVLHQHELSLFFLILLHKTWPAYSFHLPLNTLGNCIIKEWQWNNKTSTNPSNLINIWGTCQTLYQNYLLHHFNRPSYIWLCDWYSSLWLNTTFNNYWYCLYGNCANYFSKIPFCIRGKIPVKKREEAIVLTWGCTTTDDSTNNWKLGYSQAMELFQCNSY